MKYKVKKSYNTKQIQPIKLKRCDIVFVGEKYSGNKKWKNWVKCSTQENETDWVPEQILKIKKNLATVLEDYDSSELSVKKDEIVEGEKIVNGWLQCKKLNEYKHGWVPLDNLELINNS